MLIVLFLLALLAGGLSGAAVTLAVVRAAAHAGGGRSPALRHLTGLREQLQTEHAIALASADARAALDAGYRWPSPLLAAVETE